MHTEFAEARESIAEAQSPALDRCASHMGLKVAKPEISAKDGSPRKRVRPLSVYSEDPELASFMLRRLVSAQILPFRTVGFFLAVNQNTPKKFGVRYFYEQSAVLEKRHGAGLASGRTRSTLDAFRRG